jgi:hypothetical protein
MGLKGTIRTIQAAQRRAERDAKRQQRELEGRRRQFEKMEELERATYEVQVYENHLEILTSMHKEYGETWEWKSIKSSYPPPEPKRDDANERAAQDAFRTYKPSITDKVFRLAATKHQELEGAIDKAREEDDRAYKTAVKEYKAKHTEWEELVALADRILSSDLEAYYEVAKEVNPFSEISGLGSSLSYDFTTPRLAEVSIRVNGEHVIPAETKTLLKSGKLSVKKMTKTMFYELYQDYVCGSLLRVAREFFALLPLDMVIVTAVGEVLNTKTGHLEKSPIASVAIPRSTLVRLNFNQIDPSDSMQNFVHHMKFQKTKGFQVVEVVKSADLEP